MKARFISCLVLVVAALGPGLACESIPSQLPVLDLPILRLETVEPYLVLPGSWVEVTGQGFVEEGMGQIEVGLSGGTFADLSITPEWESDSRLRFQITPDLHAALGGVGNAACELTVKVTYNATGGEQHKSMPVAFMLEQTLEPSLIDFSLRDRTAAYLGTRLTAIGSGFLREGEGRTELRLEGTFTPEGAGAGVPKNGVVFNTFEVDGREHLMGGLSAQAIGIEEGRFQGQVIPVNVHADGTEVEGTGVLYVDFVLGPPLLARIEPNQAARGQAIHFYGRGFISGAATTVMRITGTFVDVRGNVTHYTEQDPLDLVPEVVAEDHARTVLRVGLDQNNEFTGLGARPGTLTVNTATPVVFYAGDAKRGRPLPESYSLQVQPMKQVVYIKYLTGFPDALVEFGLREVEDRIRTRILEVVQRDYAGISLEFRTQRPTEYVDYSVIEIDGLDPNGVGLIGLDNTMGKDLYNLNFNDLVGPLAVIKRETGRMAYGGVFVSSFTRFSTTCDRPMAIASDAFDDIFASFMPRLGGDPVQFGEFPTGDRAQDIGLAIHALGSMIGNTISHEIGHTLGLAFREDDQSKMHNNPAPNQIMDDGVDRPFEERAEIMGQGPATWAPHNRAYLQKILPLE